MFNKNDSLGIEIAAGCLIAIILVIIGPLLSYFGGWVTGVILKWFMGNTIVDGLNYLFNTTRFSADMLPRICGTLGVIGSFFKTVHTSSSKK